MNITRTLVRSTVAAVLAGTALVGATGAAQASPGVTTSVGQSGNIAYADTAATVQLTGFRSGYASGSWNANVWMHKYTGSGCTYIQAKPVASAALDGDWKRKTGNMCGAGYYSAAVSDTFYLAYNGVKFRVCKDVFGADPCGSSVTIYG